MIEKVENIEAISRFNDICALKIKALYKAYGTAYDFCAFYSQFSFDGEITAIIVKFYSSVTVTVLDNFDFQELKEFIDFISPSQVLCTEKAAQLFCKKYTTIYGMKTEVTGADCDIQATDFPTLQKVHSLFSQGDEDICIGDFEDWYVDVNHRLRHGAALVLFNESSAAILITDGKDAILNGICVEKKLRDKGEGLRMMKKVKNISGLENVFALCSQNLLPFYLKCGFCEVGKYGVIEY